MCYGISIYLSESDSFIKSWIEKAAENGFQYIFTSLHIPEEKGISFFKKVKMLGEIAQLSHMDVMADISPASLERLGLHYKELPQLKEWGISGVRMDYGFTAKQIAWLSSFLKIGLNASTVNEEQLQELLNEGLVPNQAEAWHNFYPKPFTGISSVQLEERNALFHRYGIKTMAFIPGDAVLRGPLMERLPTIEDHRNKSPLFSALELKQLGTDKICVGDIRLSDQSLKEIKSLIQQEIPLYAQFGNEYSNYYNTVHTNRMDAAQYVIRSVESRGTDFPLEQVRYSEASYHMGTITVDNKLYGRYAGELQICLHDLPANEKVNVAGFIQEESKPLLKFIGGGQKFVFLRKEFDF
ncbi:DUF871 family protein [Fictibacillus nanhaiensis]|uniref:DUF871 domain-containing protein n=1 Tax=Fictibacillus nanhaiensis TaxID=742169 RepID=UPI001C95E4A9|nr:MupG family TIM beta-alpha barrel fold protein [Fictibacillus nanhaiensis]MBY6035076.1 DUF871 family protein [Fictibacillus nanhaiensis]